MKLIELTQQTDSIKLKVVIDQINFVFKQPLQPVFMVDMAGMDGAMMSCVSNYDQVLATLDNEGFALLETPSGLKAAVNPKHILFFVSPELGLFNLMFTGKIGLVVKATTAEMEQMF